MAWMLIKRKDWVLSMGWDIGKQQFRFLYYQPLKQWARVHSSAINFLLYQYHYFKCILHDQISSNNYIYNAVWVQHYHQQLSATYFWYPNNKIFMLVKYDCFWFQELYKCVTHRQICAQSYRLISAEYAKVRVHTWKKGVALGCKWESPIHKTF